MKKLTTSVLAVVLTSSFALVNAQKDSTKTKNIEEVVITGALGIKKISDATTSAQQVVSAEQLNQAGNPNAVQALVGKVSGLVINQNNSSVNSSNSIQLRGIRTITGNNDALVVIDDAISTATILQALPPDIIESINVIKGAQGAALYGADGVNGVVIVKTKQGAKNKLSVSYDGVIDFESVAFVPKRQTKYGQGWSNHRDQFENGAWGPAFDGSTTAYGLPMYDYNGDGVITLDGIGWHPNGINASPDNPAAMIGAYSARPDEIKNFFTTGISRSNTITLNAGSEGRYAMLSLNNSGREFIIDGDKSDKTTVIFKGGVKVNKFSFDGGFNYIRTDYTQTAWMFDENSNDALYWHLLQSSPDIPITAYKDYPDNAFAWNIYYQNPYWRIKHAREDYKRDYFSATAGLGYEVNKHINVKYTGNLQRRFSTSTSHRDAFSTSIYSGAVSAYVDGLSSALFVDKREWYDYYGDFMVNFDYDLTSDINLKLNVGHNYQDHRYEVAQNGGFSLEVPEVYNMANVTQPLLPGDTRLTNGTYRKNSHAVFANLDLAYKNYLFLNATGRNEWSSVLPKNNNSYFYPSVGVSFVPTKAWDLGVLNYAKISGNWTKVGNSSPVDWYSINKTAELASGFPYTDVNSYRNGMAQTAPNIRPEFVTTQEANLDLGFFNDRVRIGGSVYQQDTKDLITRQTSSSAAGINSVLINIGKMRSKGAEINLGLVPIKTPSFKWEVNAGYSYNESIVLEVSDTADEVLLAGGGTLWGIYAQKGSVFPLIKATMMERDNQGRIIIDAATGNPIVTASLQNAGSAVPKGIYNFSTNISFKGFRLGAVADYRFGSKFIADVKSGMAFNGTLYDSGEVDRENGGYIIPNSVYQDPATGNYVPNTSIKTGGNNYDSVLTWFSSKYATYGENLLTDGKAFKIREISLSYTLPKSTVRTFGLEEFTFGVHARNPFKKFADDNLDYADPETSYYSGNARGVALRTQYPSTKVYGFTINVKF